MASTKLLFDVGGLNLVDAVRGIGWRLDPVRKEAVGSEETVVEIAVQNADKVIFADETAATISEIAEIDKEEAAKWAAENFHMLLVVFLRVVLEQRYRGKITLNPNVRKIRDFEKVDIIDDLKQYGVMKKRLEHIEGTTRFIHRGTKTIMNDSLTPLFSHLSSGISRLSAKNDKEFADVKSMLAEILSKQK